MDHRRTRCPQIGEDGHFEETCDICTIDSGRITEEQAANAAFIVAARTLLPRLLDALEDRERAYNAALTYLFHALPFEQQQRWGGDADEFIEGVQFAVARAASPSPEGEP
jgi:hypothetical protein